MSKLHLIGEELRDGGIAKVAWNNEEWLYQIRAVAKAFCHQYGCVTTDDLRIAGRSVGEPSHQNAWGAVFPKQKGWKRIGYKKSRRPEAHCRPIGVWKYEGEQP